jgi:hypothetical protein
LCPDLRERVRELERVVLELMTAKGKPGGSGQGVKLRPADLPKFGGGKEVINDWLATMVQWLGSGNCTQEQKVPLAQTFQMQVLPASGELRVQYSKLGALMSRIGTSLQVLWRQPFGH